MHSTAAAMTAYNVPQLEVSVLQDVVVYKCFNTSATFAKQIKKNIVLSLFWFSIMLVANCATVYLEKEGMICIHHFQMQE